MNRHNISDIRVFVEVARHGGFRAAAKPLGQAPASVSEAIQRLEDRLGVKLFERSTRSVALTQIGEQFFERSLPAITELEGAVSDLDDQKNDVGGTLKLSAPYSAGPFFLDDLITRFALAFPTVDVELIYDDNKVDLLTSGIDATIRSNTLLAPDTYAVSVGPELKMSIVASPDYLEKHGVPKHPRDIMDHATLCYAFGRSGQIAPWSFQEYPQRTTKRPTKKSVKGSTKSKGAAGQKQALKTYSIQPKPRLVTNDMRSLLQYASHGLGLAYLYGEIAAPLIKTKAVQDVLTKHLTPFPRYSLNYISKRHMSRRLRAFIDMAKEGG